MKRRFNWDALGAGFSLACAIHCALLPLFLTSLPLFGMNLLHNEVFEATMLLLAFTISTYSLWHGFRRHHHSVIPMVLFYAGFIFLLLKQFFIHDGNWLLVPAVLLIVMAHVANHRLCRLHNHAHADDCNH